MALYIGPYWDVPWTLHFNVLRRSVGDVIMTLVEDVHRTLVGDVLRTSAGDVPWHYIEDHMGTSIGCLLGTSSGGPREAIFIK